MEAHVRKHSCIKNLFIFYILPPYLHCVGLPQWLRDKRIHLPMQEAWVQSLGLEDPLEEEVATSSSIVGLENHIDRRA